MTHELLAEYRQKTLELQQLQKDVMTALKQSILACKPLDGVTCISSSPSIFTVKLSTLQKEGRWGVDVISPDIQIRVVAEYLFPEKRVADMSIEGVIGRIDTLIKQGYVKHYGSNRTYINSNMLKVLDELRGSLI